MLLTIAIYVKALSNGEWFGGWMPVRARLEWAAADGEAALFTITEEGLEEGDEYEFYARLLWSLLWRRELAVQSRGGY